MTIVDIAFGPWFVGSYPVESTHPEHQAIRCAIEDGALAPEDARAARWRIRDGDEVWRIQELKNGRWQVSSSRAPSGPVRIEGDWPTEGLAHDWLLQHLRFGLIAS